MITILKKIKNKLFAPADSSQVQWGNLRRFKPFSEQWGFDRGKPVDRYYIENFLQQQQSLIKGCCLELLNNNYTKQFGANRVTQSDILDIDAANPRATLIADLSVTDVLPERQYDCIIFTQVLQHIFEVDTVLKNLYRALKPGGVLLMTVPSVIRNHYEPEDHWRFTTDSIKRLIQKNTDSTDYTITAHGNLLTCVAFLMAMGTNDLQKQEMDYHDPAYSLSISAVIRKVV